MDKFLGLFTGLPMKIATGVSIVLLIAVAILSLKLHSANNHLDDAKKEIGRTEQKLATSNASLDEANKHIQANNIVIEAKAKELQATKERAAADEARLREQYRKTEATISELEADARNPKRTPCKVSPVALHALQELPE